jgi:hypothetical protein
MTLAPYFGYSKIIRAKAVRAMCACSNLASRSAPECVERAKPIVRAS